MKKSIIYLSIGTVLFSACGNNNQKEETTVLSANTSVNPANFDTTVVPGNNFFEYVNGNWLKNNPVPSTEAAWGSFNVIHENNLTNLRTLLDEASKGNFPAGSPKQKIGDFYATAVDSVKIQKDGIAPLNDELKMIAEIKNTDDLVKEIAHLHSIGVRSLFDFGIGADPKISAENIVQLGQSGLGLPDMDYYLNPDPSMEAIRKQYISYVTDMFKLAGEKEKQASEIAGKIFDFEKMLAKQSMTRVELRDIEAQYNKKSLKDFTDAYHNVKWDLYFNSFGIGSKIKDVIVSQPKFFAGVNTLISSTPINTWKDYLRWNLVNSSAGKLSDDFVNRQFAFYGTVLSGTKTLKERWKRAVQQSDNSLGELLGQLYVEKYFSAESKKKVNEMVDNLTASYKERIATREWMSAETKKQAQHKLESIMRKLAYPDKWRDYSGLEIKRDAYVLNYFRANNFDFKYMTDKLGKPVDKTEWGMSPPTVNAYYNPSYNEIVFPAGIMQSPFFDPNADDAVNYGGMGAIIGHELTHGFDDQGCQYDGEGNLKNWWTKEDSLHFKQRTNMIVSEFNHFAALDTFHINGSLTQGENIADLGGLTISYYAYKKSLAGKPEPAKINGFTGDQRFFISWAQSWRTSMRPEFLKQMLKTNPHSPGMARVIVPLSNMKEFYSAFNVKKGDAMYRPENERAEVW